MPRDFNIIFKVYDYWTQGMYEQMVFSFIGKKPNKGQILFYLPTHVLFIYELQTRLVAFKSEMQLCVL